MVPSSTVQSVVRGQRFLFLFVTNYARQLALTMLIPTTFKNGEASYFSDDDETRQKIPIRDQSRSLKADSEIFNKFGPASSRDRRCTMRNHDFVSNGLLSLIVTGLVLLCSTLLVIAFSSGAPGLLQ